VTSTVRRLLGLLCVLALVAVACGDDDDGGGGGSDTTEPSQTGESTDTDGETATDSGDAAETGDEAMADEDGVLNVPAEYDTIQAAVDTAVPGDLVLVGEGTYNEAVDVASTAGAPKENIVIRGVDRNKVILDGEFELQNGIRVLGTDGVAIENMTAQNYTKNGFFWTTDIEGYRGSYLTAIRSGDYGIYAFGARDGIVEHSYGAGSPGAGVYIGQCYPCNAIVDDFTSEYNGLGYSGTNSGGELYIINSTFRFNRAGVVPNSGSYEGCAPERETRVVGNLIYGNNQNEGPATDAAIIAQGVGFIAPGGLANIVERNRIWDHDIAGVGIAPFPEENPINAIPEDLPEDCLADAEAGSGELLASLPSPLLWPAKDHIVRGNVISDSRVADIVNAQPEEDNNRFCDNDFTSSIPADIETIAPCEGELLDHGDEGLAGFTESAFREGRAESEDYETYEYPAIGDLPGMDDPLNAPPVPANNIVIDVDLDSIAVPDMPADA
jgi:hypothetical protein